MIIIYGNPLPRGFDGRRSLGWNEKRVGICGVLDNVMGFGKGGKA